MIGCGADEVRKYFSTTLIFTIFIFCLRKADWLSPESYSWTKGCPH